MFVILLFVAGCSVQPAAQQLPEPPTTSQTPVATTQTTAAAKPVWEVGKHPLPKAPGGFGQILPTPPELVNRSLPTKDVLAPPADGKYKSTIAPIPADVLARSTWQAACPVTKDELRYLTMSFWGFDDRPHTGEMIVNTKVAQQVTGVFGKLYAAKFPIEEMLVTAPPELTAPPTGDGNSTTAFVCRPARGQTNWSAHAYGLAVDINPFCNPYSKGELVLPELASAYLDRGRVRPGMIRAGDTVERAFAAIGWTWGGTWRTPKDLMHFSATGS
ncbi:M15 family metallopeptidase [Kibdelosporangium philippinense]|uniref:M15 family metallopeptidase n=1 Tax=Kibdelosporangium philippinense TaxID=211113 RepID=A0ABS8ZMI3_9PSEU|nr:M15 family metallopeptidase [Kibdelosporangium philippinense]MCE7007653.1 M15 family metallopeptidase [Kibdelosporangium philippinense]